jgi:hypothetical protein
MPVLSPGERLERLEGMKGVELTALMHYAEGREESPTRDQVIGLVLVVAGERYLAKQAAKAAKRTKRIL